MEEKNKIVVFVMDRHELDNSEKSKLEAMFPDRELEYRSWWPNNAQDHLRWCKRFEPDVIVLPNVQPVVSLAIKEFAHVSITADGIRELVAYKEEFKPFEPKDKK